MRHADTVAHTARFNAPAAAIRVEGNQQCEFIPIKFADIAVHTDICVNSSIRAKRGEFPVVITTMFLFGRQSEGRGQFYWGRHIVQIGFDIVITQHAIGREDIETVTNHHQPIGLHQTLSDDTRAGGAIRIAADGINTANGARAGKHCTARAFRHHARARNAMGENLGLEAGWQANGAHRHFRQGGYGQARRVWRQR